MFKVFADAVFFTNRKNWEFLWKEIKNEPEIANAVISKLDAKNETYPNQYQWLSKNVFERKWEAFQTPTDIRVFENLLRLLGKLTTQGANTADKHELVLVRKTIASIKSLLSYKDCFYIQRYIEQAQSSDVVYFDELLHNKIAISESMRATLSKHVVKRLAADASLSYGEAERQKQEKEKQDDQTLYVTENSLRRKKKEYEEIIKVQIPQTLIDIRVAREHGDLSENAEYDAAQEKPSPLP